MSAVPPGSDGEVPEDAADAGRPEERRRVDVEAAWAEIVAHWDAAPPAAATWPASEDAGPASGRPAGSPPPGTPPAGDEDLEQWWDDGRPPARHRRTGGDGRAAPVGRTERTPDPAGDADAAADDRYTPPEPPPLARGGWRSWLPWVGVLGAPVFFVVFAVAHLALPGLLLLAVVAAFVAGFVTLVLRLPASRGDDDDDGAVV